ncbi:hypothetical protein GS891_12235 [Rhodococcus hoagii]|nr:hypothetical protein [Prescottella equi]
MPTTRAAPLKNRQLIFTGTPPGEKDNGEVFTRRRQNTIDQKSSRSCWHEWSCADGVDYDDPQAWAQANPALGFRLDAETVQEDRDLAQRQRFARECLGHVVGGDLAGPDRRDVLGRLRRARLADRRCARRGRRHRPGQPRRVDRCRRATRPTAVRTSRWSRNRAGIGWIVTTSSR